MAFKSIVISYLYYSLFSMLYYFETVGFSLKTIPGFSTPIYK